MLGVSSSTRQCLAPASSTRAALPCRAQVTMCQRPLLAATKPLSSTFSLTGSGIIPFRSRCTPRQSRSTQSPTLARIKDPDALDAEAAALKEPPNTFWRAMAALMYLIPWIDTIAIGREVYHNFPSSILLYFLPGPFVGIYYSSQFAPLIVFFLLFLSVVKNNKLHHFVRFNCMQAIMLDIVVMLFHILRAYFPAELRWSIVLQTFDKFAWTACMATVLYCVYFAIRGFYADIPYVSESVYIQVDASEYS